jgi:hypothetical protein
LSRGGLRELLATAKLNPGWAATWRPDPPAPAVHLVEVDSFVAAADPRLGALQQAARGEVLRATPLGGYARPLSPG